MSRHAFYVYNDRVYHIANPCAAGVNYHAREMVLTPGELTTPGQHASSETVIVVTEGQIEMMVNGASATLAAGQFARVRPGHWFAMRNGDYRLARVLMRVAPVPARAPQRRIVVEIAAA